MRGILSAKTFKNRMVLCFTFVGITPIIILSIIYMSVFEKRNFENFVEENQKNIKYIMTNVDKQLTRIEKVSFWFYSNKQLDQVLTTQYEDDIKRNVDIINFNKYAQEYILNSFTDSSLSKILITGNNGVELQLGDDTSVIDADSVKNKKWFELYQDAKITDLVISPEKYHKNTYVFPISRDIVSSMSEKPIGKSILFFQSNLISSVFNQFEIPNGDELFIINDKGQCVAHQKAMYIGQNFLDREYVETILAKDKYNDKQKYIKTMIGNKEYIINYYKHPYNHLIIIQASPLDIYYSSKLLFTHITIAVLCFTAIALLGSVIFLSIQLTKPIKGILGHLKSISGGVLEIDKTTEGEDEIGTIGKGINDMVENISFLVDKLIEEERVKKDLEFKMLQNQINPHFLYNTLNCIKWMATIQNAVGISDMTGALASILQNISKGTDDKIPVYEEFLLVDDYMCIQNIRYNGKISLEYHIEESDLTTASIIKFTLQPIIENAIFHGIEPKQGTGKIDVFLKKVGEDLNIIIRDDGVGMNEKQLKQLFSEPLSNNKSSMNAIGIKNVDERLKIYYGEAYGLSVTSQEGLYTEVKICIPYEKVREDGGGEYA
ncbi:sensor histidine kinase [Cellulosilyticum sp. I15G10I2]|uniref:sensor histidine kinase n=1 Tax=Cellulosilyticum sp. I15G10I2 TaxID=1892843 RepID=UPI00085C7CFF|nr:sensor histidine kinase [Cellulosilyticum sp. I15G10I2]